MQQLVQQTNALQSGASLKAPTREELEVQYRKFEKHVSENYYLFFSAPYPHTQKTEKELTNG